jgi:hypothetical protein
MRIGIDLKASHLPNITIHAHTPNERASSRPNVSSGARAFSVGLALIALCAGCNAVVNFGDFKFGPTEDERDAGAADSGAAADGGERDSGNGQPGKDGSVPPKDDGGVTQDGSVSNGDSGTGADGSVSDGGNVDSGTGNSDSGPSCPAEICDNGVDDDCDRQSDCDDSDCLGQSNCCSVTPENTVDECRDQRDNDCNGRTDCGDLNCSGTLACCTAASIAENTMAMCTDGIDNDCDGKVDCVDSECGGMAACCGVVSAGTDDPITPSCCTPDGMNEADAPNDGKDNDCDGLVDIPVLMSAFPVQGLPSSADEVRLTFAPEMNPSATLACSTKRPGQTPAFSPCQLAGISVKPFDSTQSANALNNGLWITQVRWDFPDGRHSASYTFRYYVHSSLHNVSHCTPFHMDQQWFNVAAPRLAPPVPGVKDTFKLGLDTFLTSPFIRVKYEVPWSGQTQFMLTDATPSRDMWSLRRRFSLGNMNKYLLIQRNYKSTRSTSPDSCSAAAFKIHDTHSGTNKSFRTYTCQAVVLNRAGAGVCLNNGATSAAGPVIVHPSNDPVSNGLGWQYANKFMWRQLLETKGKVNKVSRNFTTKCTTFGCPGIYLPDRSQFGP